jgi:hypothetical protein
LHHLGLQVLLLQQQQQQQHWLVIMFSHLMAGLVSPGAAAYGQKQMLSRPLLQQQQQLRQPASLLASQHSSQQQLRGVAVTVPLLGSWGGEDAANLHMLGLQRRCRNSFHWGNRCPTHSVACIASPGSALCRGDAAQ